MNRILRPILLALWACLVAGQSLAAVPVAPKLYYTTNGLDLSVIWTEVPGASSYTLYYAPHPFTGDGIGSFNMGSETRLDVSLWEGAAYYVAVVANNSDGSSGLSNVQQFVTSTVIPSAPQLIYDPSGTSATIAWDTSSRATGYRLSMMPTAYTFPWDFTTTDVGLQTSFTYDHLQVGGTYTVAVQAYNAHGTSGYSNIETFTVPDPQPPRYVTVAGPSGVTLETPANNPDGGSNVSLLAGGNDEGLLNPGESLASLVVKVSVAGGGGTENMAPSTLSIPVDPAYRANPDKLIVKVKLSTGVVLPVAGWYDTATGSYRFQVDDFTDGWQLALINNPLQVIYRSAPSGISALRRVTSMDWVTYDWEVVVDDPALVTANEVAIIVDRLKKASLAYDSAGFRSPRLFINPSLRRTVIIETSYANDVGYGYTILPNEDSPEFDVAMMTKDDADKFGFIVIDIAYVRNLLSNDTNYSLDQILAHELFHAVQGGYDIRTNNVRNFKYYKDGTATPVGVTYERTGGIIGPAALTRNLVNEQQHAMLDEAIDCQGSIYSKQDFFVYLAKKYRGGSFSYLHDMFDTMHSLTASRPGMLYTDSYSVFLLRSAMSTSFRNKLQVSLAEAYFTFVEDRAYRHSEKAILRPADESLEEMTLDKSIFKTAYIDQLETYRSINDVWRTVDLVPLQAKFVQIELPRVPEEVKLPLKFKVTGGELGAETLKLLVLRDGTEAEPVEVTTLDEPTLVPVDSTTTSLTVLAMNGYVNPNRSEISMSTAKPEIVSISPQNPNPGDQVTISGKLFGERAVTEYSKLWLNEHQVVPISWTDTEIRFTLPPMGQEGTLSQNTIYIENLAGTSNEIDFTVNLLGVSSLLISWETRIEYGLPGEIHGVEEEQASLSFTLPNVEILPYNPADWLPICADGCPGEIPVLLANNIMASGFTPITANVSVTEHNLRDGILKPVYKCSVSDSSSRLNVARVTTNNPAMKEYLLETSASLLIPVGHNCERWVEDSNGSGSWEDVVSYSSYGYEADRYLRGEESKLFFENGAALEAFVANPRGGQSFNFSPVIDEINVEGDIHKVTRFNVNLNLVVNQ